MTLKELIRLAITGEMEDISGCEDDAGLFSARPDAAEFLSALAAEKRERLLQLGKIFKEGVGFRQRKDVVSRSMEAALRGRAVRAEKASSVYASLSRLINKPENKEALKNLAARELEILAEIRGLQASLKK